MINGIVTETSVPIPKVIYNKCSLGSHSTINRLEKIIGINRIFNYRNRLNKWQIYKALESSTLKKHLPITKRFITGELKEWLTDNIFYLKPCYSHQGKGVFRCEVIKNEIMISEDSLAPRHILDINSKQITKHINNLIMGKKYIIQRGVPLLQFNQKHFDIRVLVQKNIDGIWKITSIVSRLTYRDYFNTSVIEEVIESERILKSLFFEEEAIKILSTLRYLSIEAADHVEKNIGLMGELSVDFGIDPDGKLWIIEVNGKPSKSIYREHFKNEEYGTAVMRPLEYAKFLYFNSH
ncbi:YheC/YheD family protein [Ureibacillus sp. NPDC094379]